MASSRRPTFTRGWATSAPDFPAPCPWRGSPALRRVVPPGHRRDRSADQSGRRSLRQRIADIRSAGSRSGSREEPPEAGDAQGARQFRERAPSNPDRRCPATHGSARALAAHQQARDDRVRSLLAEAADAEAHGRLDAALALAGQALAAASRPCRRGEATRVRQISQRRRRRKHVTSASSNARDVRCSSRDLDEADRRSSWLCRPERRIPIATSRTAVVETRKAREKADALVEEVGLSWRSRGMSSRAATARWRSSGSRRWPSGIHPAPLCTSSSSGSDQEAASERPSRPTTRLTGWPWRLRSARQGRCADRHPPRGGGARSGAEPRGRAADVSGRACATA